MSSVKLKVNGSKNKGYIFVDSLKFGDHWVTTNLRVSSEKEKAKITEIINLETDTTVEKKSPPDIVDILKKFKISKEEGSDFLVVSRSDDLNDFMQSRLDEAKYPELCYIIEYSHGNQAYVAKRCYADVNEVVNIFYSYMTGKDDFMK